MTNREDGGPAYPATFDEWDGHSERWRITSSGGASLRDYFAALAPPPPEWWMDQYGSKVNTLDEVAQCIAQWNFVYADAMLKARQA